MCVTVVLAFFVQTLRRTAHMDSTPSAKRPCIDVAPAAIAVHPPGLVSFATGATAAAALEATAAGAVAPSTHAATATPMAAAAAVPTAAAGAAPLAAAAAAAVAPDTLLRRSPRLKAQEPQAKAVPAAARGGPVKRKLASSKLGAVDHSSEAVGSAISDVGRQSGARVRAAAVLEVLKAVASAQPTADSACDVRLYRKAAPGKADKEAGWKRGVPQIYVPGEGRGGPAASKDRVKYKTRFEAHIVHVQSSRSGSTIKPIWP